MTIAPSIDDAKPEFGTAEYNAWKVRRYRERQKAKKAEEIAGMAERASAASSSKLDRLASLILEAQRLAAEINREIVDSLKAAPMTKEVALSLAELEDKEMRISFAKVNLPL